MATKVQDAFAVIDKATGEVVALRQQTPGAPELPLLRRQQQAALTGSMADATGGARGFVGNVTPDSFGMHWIRTPLNFDATAGTAAAARQDQTAVYGGTEGAGWVRVFFGFDANGPCSGIFTAGTTTFVDNRLADLFYLLRFWHGRGKKVLMVWNAPVVLASASTTLFRDRLTRLFLAFSAQEDYPDAIEFMNEPYGAMAATGDGTAAMLKVAELQRVGYVLTKVFSPKTVVCSPTFQGGETAFVEGFLAASAAGVAVRGSTGAGTRGEQYCDVIAYHPYGVATTTALASQTSSSAYAEQTIRAYSAWIQVAVANRRQAPDGGAAWWSGKPDPEYWATELNVTFDGGNITSNTQFRMQAYSPAQRRRLMESQVLGCLASGYSKVFPYAVDHMGDQGPWTPSGTVPNANADMRITGGSAPCFDGDVVFVAGGNQPYDMQGTVYEATANGLQYSLAGVPAYAPSYSRVQRWLLGGWHREWPAIQQSVIGAVEAGFSADGLPQLRVDRGEIRRLVAGRMQAVAL